MHLNHIVVEVIEAATAAALQDAINAFLVAPGERTFLSMQYMAFDNAHYSALIVYTK